MVLITKPQMNVSRTVDEIHACLGQSFSCRPWNVTRREKEGGSGAMKKPLVLTDQRVGQGTIQERSFGFERQREGSPWSLELQQSIGLGLLRGRVLREIDSPDEWQTPEVRETQIDVLGCDSPSHVRYYHMSVINGQGCTRDSRFQRSRRKSPSPAIGRRCPLSRRPPEP